VRPTGRLNSVVEVRAEVSHDLVAEGNCVAARQGGEQLEANWQSVGNEPDSAECCGEPAGLEAKPGNTAHGCDGEKGCAGGTTCMGTECQEVKASGAGIPMQVK